MNNSFKTSMSSNEEQQYFKEMRKNNLLFEQKLQKLKQKANEFKQKETFQNNIKPIKNRKRDTFSPKIETNYQSLVSNYNRNINNNTSLDFSKQESNEIKSVFNKDYYMNNVSNISIKDFLFNDEDTFSNSNINKDNKIKELIKKNQDLKNELEYKNKIIESLEIKIETLKDKNNNNDKIEEMNFELGHLTREIEEKNQKIENYEINQKNLNYKLDNLLLQNKNLTNKEKKLTDKNDYLMSTMDKMKEDNEALNKKINKLEKLNKNLLKDYEELNNDFNKIRLEKEKYESSSDEQKRKISELTKEVKDLRNLLKNYLNNKNNSENEEESEFNIKVNLVNSRSCQTRKNNMKFNDGFSEYEIKSDNNLFDRNQNNFNTNISDRYRKIFDYKDDDFNTFINHSNLNKRYSNKFSNERCKIRSTSEEANKLIEDTNIRSSSLEQRSKKNYFDTEIKENKYNGAENNNLISKNGNYKNNNLSARNIFSAKKNSMEYNYTNNSKKKFFLSSKKIKDPRTKELFDYEGYEGFNCFPCERTVKKNKKEIDELNNELNSLLKNKNIIESSLNKLPSKVKSINIMRQKRELNNKIKITENKINEIRFKIKKLMKGT